MKRPGLLNVILISTLSVLVSCGKKSAGIPPQQEAGSFSDSAIVSDTIVYRSDNLVVRRLSNHVFQHISYLNTQDFGRVGCNGMVVVNEGEAVVFDTPADDESSRELIGFVTTGLGSKIKGVIPTHFHADCVGGMDVFHSLDIPSYASLRTIELLNEHDRRFSRPITVFDGALTLTVGGKEVYAEYFGEGHTKDNIIGYFPADRAVFGGCLIKELNAGKGNLEDANVESWAPTVQRIRERFPKGTIVIPGHGETGGTELFDYTIRLFDIRSSAD